MHLALLCEYASVNGGENSILAMVEQLPDVRVSVLAPPGGRLARRLAQADIRHIPFSAHESDGTRRDRQTLLADLQEIVASLRPDLLHANSLSMGRLSGAARSSFRIRIPVTAHLRDILRLKASAVSDLNANDLLLAVSQATRTFHVAQGLDPARTLVLSNGIDTDAFRPRSRTGCLLSELRLPPTAQLVATIGQITLRKGQDTFLESAAIASAACPAANWLIIGERYSAKAETLEFERHLRQVARSSGLDGRVHWLGYRDDVAALLPEIDLLVHPARQEPLGRVLLEAAACGVPIIATAVGGTSEIIDDARTGVLILPDDPPALAAAIAGLLHDRDHRADLGKAARERVVASFSIRERAAEIAAHWHDLRVTFGSRAPPSPRILS